MQEQEDRYELAVNELGWKLGASFRGVWEQSSSSAMGGIQGLASCSGWQMHSMTQEVLARPIFLNKETRS